MENESLCSEDTSGIGDMSNLDESSNLGGSSVSGESIHTDDFSMIEDPFITKEILKEEKRLEKISARQLELQQRKLEKEKHLKELKEKRYQGLMSLLEKSQFYSEFAVNKLKSVEKDMSKPKKRKRGDLENLSSEIKAKAMKTNINESPNSRISLKDLSSNWINIKEETKTDEVCKGTRQTSLGIEVSNSQPKLLIGASLRDYQLEGLSWLKRLFVAGMNGILADEMGLGKTIQIIALICHLYEEGVIGPFLIVAPLSTLPNWMAEFEAFAPDVPVILYHGDVNTRQSLRTGFSKRKKLEGFLSCPTVLTSYEVPLKDEKFLQQINWKYVIVDEGHRLKNHKSMLTRCLSRLHTVNRMLLTGTPLQNNLTELWSLLNFLMPEMFVNLDDFNAWFEVEDLEKKNTETLMRNERGKEVLGTLHQILTPFLLRRVKTDVNLNLPSKKELVVHCPLTELQYKLYSATLNKSIDKMRQYYKKKEVLIIEDNPDGSRKRRTCTLTRKSYLERRSQDSFSSQGSVQEFFLQNNSVKEEIEVDDEDDTYVMSVKMANPMMMLRKISNHPYLVQMPVIPGSSWMRINEKLVTSCGKMMVLDALLAKLKERNHKVLLFSTFTTVLDILEGYMEMRNYGFVRLDGATSLEERKNNIKHFNTNPDLFVFLISTRAGGLGINLTAADTVIIYNSDWNPQADLQAQDRCHRIGQTKPVIVYRLVTSSTIDEKIVCRGVAKRKLEKMVIHAGKFKYFDGSVKEKLLDLEMLKDLLEKKSHSSEIHSNGSVLTDEQWDYLMDRSNM